LCPTASGEIGKSLGTKSLKIENFKKFLNENNFIKEIELSNWGELFLNPDILDILKFAHSKSVSLTANNGTNLNTITDDVIEALVLYGFKSISCSIDGVSQDTYGKYRVRGDISKVFENIKKINKFKKIYKSSLPHLKWQYIVFGHNEHEVLEAQKKAKELDMSFSIKFNWDDSFSPVKDKELIRRLSLSGVSSRAEYTQTTGKSYKNEICRQLWKAPQINSDGKLLGCCVNYWKDFGNVFETPFTKLLKSSDYQYARLMLMGKVKERQDIACTSCDLYKDRKVNGNWIKQREIFLPGKVLNLLETVSGFLRKIFNFKKL
jgi:MoaA/NifB/PqqE/SkfB family radical SAM enzyme